VWAGAGYASRASMKLPRNREFQLFAGRQLDDEEALQVSNDIAFKCKLEINLAVDRYTWCGVAWARR